MPLQEKISCICVTKNRSELLKRAIFCFQNQEYSNKELIIVSISDVQTTEFAIQHPEYRRIKISETHSPIPTIYLEVISNPVLQLHEVKSNINIHLLDSTGQYFSDKNNKPSIFTLIINPQGFSIQNQSDQFLSFDENFEITSSKNPIFLDVFQAYNNKIQVKPKVEYSDIYPELERENWTTEVLNDINSSVILIEAHPLNDISLGCQRNLSIKAATGELISVWDDDDWYSPKRLKFQYEGLQLSGKHASTLSNQVLFDANSGQAYLTFPRGEGCENTILCYKDKLGLYDDLPRKEDTPVLYRLWMSRNLTVVEAPYLYIYNIHKFNTCPSDHFLFIIKISTKIKDSKLVQELLLEYKEYEKAEVL